MFSQFRGKEKNDENKEKKNTSTNKDSGKDKQNANTNKDNSKDKHSKGTDNIKQQTKVTGKQQTTNKASGGETHNTSNQKNKDEYTTKSGGDGETGKGKYSPDDRYDAFDPRKATKHSGERYDNARRHDIGSNENDRSGNKSYVDGGSDEKMTRYDRKNEAGRRDYDRQGYRGQGDTREDVSGAGRKYGEQRTKYSNDASGDYLSGKLNDTLTNTSHSDDLTDKVNVNIFNVGKGKSSVEMGENNEQRVPSFHLDRIGNGTSTRDEITSEGIKTNYDDKKWATLANEAHLEETRRQFTQQHCCDADDNGHRQSHSNLLVHNIGNNIHDEIHREIINGERKLSSKNVSNNKTGSSSNELYDKQNTHHNTMSYESHNVGNTFFNTDTSKNLLGKTYKNNETKTLWNKNKNENEMNHINQYMNSDGKHSDNIINTNTSLQDTVAFERTNKNINESDHRSEKYNQFETHADTQNKNNVSNNTSRATDTSLKDLDEDFKKSIRNSNQNHTGTGKTKNRIPLQYSNKVQALMEQSNETKGVKINREGFQNKVRNAWNKTPRHFKGILFVFIVFALFTFALQRIVLHRKQK